MVYSGVPIVMWAWISVLFIVIVVFWLLVRLRAVSIVSGITSVLFSLGFLGGCSPSIIVLLLASLAVVIQVVWHCLVVGVFFVVSSCSCVCIAVCREAVARVRRPGIDMSIEAIMRVDTSCLFRAKILRSVAVDVFPQPPQGA